MEHHAKVLQKIKRFGFNPKKILDIGAYRGLWTENCKKIFPQCDYILIEANDKHELKKYGDNYINEVLSDDIKEVDWYQMNGTGDSYFKERTYFYNKCKPNKKTTNTLDNLFNNKVFDLIKLDVQGAEIDVLKGGLNIIKNTTFIILEIPFHGKYNMNTPSFLDHIKFMDENDFIPFDIIDIEGMRINKYRGNHCDTLVQIDMVFIKKSSEINEIVQKRIDYLCRPP